jgi:hypothetical protein
MNETRKYICKKYVNGKKFNIQELIGLKEIIDKYEYDDTTWAIENYNQQKVKEDRNGRVWEIIKGIELMIRKIQKIERDTYLRFNFLENGKYTFYCEYKKEFEQLTKDDIELIWQAC